MKEIIIGVVICAALFMLYGLLPHRGCTGHCAGCSASCWRFKGDDHHDA